ncbi:MAG: hypothetical protein ABI559_07750 [Chloroflexota bacterium]
MPNYLSNSDPGELRWYWDASDTHNNVTNEFPTYHSAPVTDCNPII